MVVDKNTNKNTSSQSSSQFSNHIDKQDSVSSSLLEINHLESSLREMQKTKKGSKLNSGWKDVQRNGTRSRSENIKEGSYLCILNLKEKLTSKESINKKEREK